MALPAPISKRQPIPFGKYLLLDRINIGGMAEVWRGKSFGAGGFERLVAIKRILPNIAEDEEFITMFIDEAKITSQLAHANIGQVYELGQINSSYFIAMEYISGKDMRAIFDRCRKKGEPPPIPLACYLIAKTAEGLDYAHRKSDSRGNLMNIVHRDVSPQNALVSYDGEVKVIDFGIAKAAGKATKTQAGILKGKFGYMSPEQIRGLPLDRRSDVFAIGVCLYEMLTGERLFVGDSDFSVLEKVRKVEVLPPSTYNRKIPEALEKVVMKALAKDVDDRYQYASELADDLQRFLISTESVFGRKDLAQYMRATFAEEVEKEKARLVEYADVKAPEGVPMGGEAPFAPTAPTPALSPPGAPPPQVTPSVRTSPNVPALRGGAPAPDPRRNSGHSIPRLTAVAPLLTNGQGEHEATVMLGPDGKPMMAGGGGVSAGGMPHDTGFDFDDPAPAPELAALAGAAYEEDDGKHTVPMMSNKVDPESFEKTIARPPATQAAAPAPSHARGGSATATAARGGLPPIRRNGPAPARPPPNMGVVREVSSAPVRAGHAGNEPSQVTKIPSRGVSKPLLFGGIAAAIIVPVAVVAVVLKVVLGGPEGLLMIDLPEELAGMAHINVNGEELKEPDGTLLRSFPVMRKVKAGKVAVLIKAPGYKTLDEVVEVKEGNDYSRLRKRLEKLKQPEAAPEGGPKPPGGAPEGQPTPPDAPAPAPSP